MRFLFVDRITSIAGDRITGQRRFPVAEPLRYASAHGGEQVAPGVVSEAVGQLASWLALQRNDFTGRPVFLFADRIAVHGPVRPGDEVELAAELTQCDAESLRFSGTASVRGEVVISVRDCSGYFMPLGELEDPTVTRARFAALSGAGLVLLGHEGEPYDFTPLAGVTTARERGVAVTTRTTLAAGEPFYADHFPRFPVTPIVILNEMIGFATARLFGDETMARLAVRATEDVKIRAFVRPGDVCETRVQVTATSEAGDARRITTTAEILRDGRRILRGAYDYDFLG